jgi:membrane protein
VARQPDVPGQRFALVVAVLRVLVQGRGAGERGLSLDALARRLRIDPLQVEPVLDTLVAMDWCGRLDEPEANRHVLLIDPAATPAVALVDALLLADQTATQGFRRHARLATMTVAELVA